MKKLWVLLALAATAACAHRPAWVTSGERWTLPLVDPLGRSELTVAVTIDGKGPYPFVISTGSAYSFIDEGVAQELGLYTNNNWVTFVTQSDHRQQAKIYEVPWLVSGDFRAHGTPMFGAPKGSLSAGRHRVAGLLGGNLVSDSLVIDIDRDRGVVRLAVAGHEAPPPAGGMVAANRYYGQLLVPAEVDGRSLTLALDLTAAHTAARGIRGGGGTTLVVDESGDARHAALRVTPSRLRVDGVTAEVNLAEYVDRRVRAVEYDGVLGQDFLQNARVIIDAHRNRLWLAPRAGDLAADTAARIARWGGDFAACAATGCATVSPSADGVTITPAVSRGQFVTVEALDRDGQPIGLRRVRVEGGPTTVAMDGAAVRVVDVAPVL